MNLTLLDRAISYLSPGWAVKRIEARATLSQVLSSSDQNLGYSAGRITIYDKGRTSAGTHAENAIDVSQFARLRFKAWQLYRENKHARKIVRQIIAKVIGSRGLIPDPMPLKPDGTVHTKAQEAIRRVWLNWIKRPDSRGNPGQGGQSFAGIQQTALRAAILSGESLYRMRVVDQIAQDKRGLEIPVVVQLIDAERLADDLHGVLVERDHLFFRGIELDKDGNRYRYWIHNAVSGVNVADVRAIQAEPYSAAEIFHLFVTDDIDQYRGTSWFAPALNSGRDINDLEYNVLKQTAIASCIVAGYRLSRGKSRLGLATGDSDDLTDANGNKVDRLHSGMFINLGKDGDLKGFSPQINQAGQESIIQLFQRGQAAALPGIKPTTVTGDYRAATFSSEKAADNDAWPELEIVQQWFTETFNQPVYETVIKQAVINGLVPGVSAEYFEKYRTLLTNCLWYGPVARSINPTDDAKAAQLRMHIGVSSPQMECSQIGRRFEDVLQNVADYRAKCDSMDIPEVYPNNVLGLDTKDLIEADAASSGGTDSEPIQQAEASTNAD